MSGQSKPLDGMRGSLLVVVAVGLIVGMAGHATADTKAYDVALMEGEGCPDEEPMCIEVEAANEQADGTVDDPHANVTITGEHPIELNVTNEGQSVHNLTFEPGTPAANHSHDEPLMPGDSVNITLTTVEDVPAGEYLFYSGQAADRELGMTGELVIQSVDASSGQADGGPTGDDDTRGEGNVTPEEDAVPAPGAAITLGALAASVAAAAWRRS